MLISPVVSAESGLPPSVGKLCDPPEVSEEMKLFPFKEIYKEGQVVGFNCKGSGLIPSYSGVSTCTLNRPVFTWDPPIPSNIVCKDGAYGCLRQVQMTDSLGCPDNVRISVYSLFSTTASKCPGRMTDLSFSFVPAENPFIPDFECKRGEQIQGSKCVCVPRESCL